MARPSNCSEGGTLIIAALLLLTLGFSGYWIAEYARLGDEPWTVAIWFAIGAALIIVVGVTAYVLGWGHERGSD